MRGRARCYAAHIMGYRREQRFFDRDEDMGGSEWSGSSGRGGVVYPEREREHQGFSNYAGGGARDMRHHESHWRAEEIDRGPHWGKGPKGYKRSDERIKEDVCDVIAQQGHVDATDVDVRVENAVVILSGTVASRDDKRALEHLADRVHGIHDIRNDIRVRRDEPRREQPNGNRTTTARH